MGCEGGFQAFCIILDICIAQAFDETSGPLEFSLSRGGYGGASKSLPVSPIP